jgi:hypothetical protein
VISRLRKALEEIESGNKSSITDPEFGKFMSDCASELLELPFWDENMIVVADIIYRYSNIAYNCTDNDVLPLDDGVYDQLLEIYKKYNPRYQVGYKPVQFNNSTDQRQYSSQDEMKVMCISISDEERDV